MSTLISAAGFGLAVSGVIGAASAATYYQAAQPDAPTSAGAYQSWLTVLKADGSKVAQPASQWYTAADGTAVATSSPAAIAAVK